jgi:WD40 repeat protein/transcriptional regulator with XRE-family HTH domain
MPSSIPENTLEKFTTFGDLLRFLRRRVGITQLELSIAVGYSDAQISRLEQNLRPPDIPTIEARFVSALGLEEEPKAVQRLLDLAAHVRREDAPGLGLCPYKGLNCFDEGDADLFVGREELTAKLVERALSLTSRELALQTCFLAIVGASGSGKSSLVQAGLIPALRWNKKSIDWPIHLLTPTAHPLESLAASLTHENPSASAVATLMDDFMRDPRSLQIVAKRKLGANDGSYLLLVVDQFEELFALCRSEEERTAFIGNLLSAASEADGRVVVLITLRADFYAHCANYLQLRDALAANQEYIGAMSEEELRRAIEEPARRGRWEFEPGLVDLLLHDIGREPGALPLLSHALLETWQRRRGRMMTLSGYTSSGGVRGAIAETAESVFADQFTQVQQETARRIFLRLTELGDETATGDTRRRTKFEELILNPEETNTTHTLLKVLADARLIVTSEDTVEVSHEALIREWPRLRSWLEDNREGLRLHRQLTEAAQEWDSLHREPDLLYRGARLAQTQEWAATHQEEMNRLEREFLEASISFAEYEASEREAQRQRELEAARKLAESEKQRAEEQAQSAAQLNKRARYLTGAFILALLMAFTALYFGSQARRTAVTAQTERRIATARELAAAALNNLDVEPERSLLLALQSVATTKDVDGTILPESIEALHHSLVASPIRLTLKGHEMWVVSAAYSPDGKTLATIGRDGATILWDVLSGKEIRRLQGGTTVTDAFGTQRLAFHPQENQLAIADSDHINIWDIPSGELITTLSGHKGDVWAIEFSPDGKRLAGGCTDGTALIWDIATGEALILEGHTLAIEGLAFKPDGRWLATASDDQTMKLWDTTTGQLLRDVTGFPDIVDSVSFNSDGTRLATASTGAHIQIWDATKIDGEEILRIEENVSVVTFSPDGTQISAASGSNVKIWDASTGQELRTLIGHKGWVIDIVFSPDGKQLATTSFDNTTKVWSITPGQEAITVSGQGIGFAHVAFSPDATQLATDGVDGSATIWDATTGEVKHTLMGHTDRVIGIAFSQDNHLLATVSFDGMAIVWDTKSGEKVHALSAHQGGARDVAFSPDGKRIATGGFDGAARIWDVATGEEVLAFSEGEGFILGVAFSPDGTKLATSSTNTTAAIWDLKTGERLFTLEGHTDPLPDVAYSPDGKQLATASQDGTAIVWDAATGSKLLTLTGHGSEIQSVAFSPDGKQITTGSGDNTAKLWDAETGEEIFTLPGSAGGVTGVAFSPSDGGAHLAVASVDGVVRIFFLQIDELVELAKTRVTRSLTTEECRKYLHVDRCPAET